MNFFYELCKTNKIESTRVEITKVLNQLQHKRFIKMNEKLSSLRCYWYVPTEISIATLGNDNDNDNDSKHLRPDHVYKLVQ